MHDHDFAIRMMLDLIGEAGNSVHGRRVCLDHAADRVAYYAGSCHGTANAVADRGCFHVGVERNIVHVDQVAAQRRDIDPGPIRFRVGIQQRDNLLDCGKGALTGFLGERARHFRRGRFVLHLVVMIHMTAYIHLGRLRRNGNHKHRGSGKGVFDHDCSEIWFDFHLVRI